MRDFTGIDAQVAATIKAAEEAQFIQERLLLVERYGHDPNSEGTVLRFDKQFTDGGIVYKYAAIKIGDKYYTTGPSEGRYTWQSLVLWLVSGAYPVPPSDVQVAIDWSQLEPAF